MTAKLLGVWPYRPPRADCRVVVGIGSSSDEDADMQERSESQSPKSFVDDDGGSAGFYAASIAVIERLTEQLDRRDRSIALKDERQQGLDQEVVQLRAAIANLQRSNVDARSAYNAGQVDRQRTIELNELRSLHGSLRKSDESRAALVEKNLALETAVRELRAELASARLERARVVALSKEITARNRIEIERTRVQIAQVDAMIAQIHRSFFWKLKGRLSMLRSPLRSVRAVVRR